MKIKSKQNKKTRNPTKRDQTCGYQQRTAGAGELEEGEGNQKAQTSSYDIDEY